MVGGQIEQKSSHLFRKGQKNGKPPSQGSEVLVPSSGACKRGGGGIPNGKGGGASKKESDNWSKRKVGFRQFGLREGQIRGGLYTLGCLEDMPEIKEKEQRGDWV